MFQKLFIFIAILALATMACGFNIDLPQKAQPGPEVVDDVRVDYPEADETNLKLSFGAGDLILSPGTIRLVNGKQPTIMKNSNLKSSPMAAMWKSKWADLASMSSLPLMDSKTNGISNLATSP